MSDPPIPLLPWILLGVIAVAKSDRVQGQYNGCGQEIYAAIHMIRLPTGAIECWGIDCYAREAGARGGMGSKPLFPGLNGRQLTADERSLLTTNREQLIAHFKAEHDEALQRLDEAAKAQDARKAVAEAVGMAEARAWNAWAATRAAAPVHKPAMPVDQPSTVRSVYDLAPRKCIFCGEVTTEWWTSVRADECKCKECSKAGRW